MRSAVRYRAGSMNFRETRGMLVGVEKLPDGTRLASGWVGAIGMDPVQDVDVLIDGAPLDRDLMEASRVGSPDVQLHHPDLTAASTARFYVRIERSVFDNSPHKDGHLLCVLPRFADGVHGLPLYQVFETNIPLPSEEATTSVGGSLEAGHQVLSQLVARLDFLPTDRVLDVGCGVGRVAYPLAYYMRGSGFLEGFDVMPEAIEWANSSIGQHRPNFKFDHVDIYNKRYNPRGRIRSESFRFPYPDSRFSLAFLTSVFTHMLEGEIQRYLDELHRVVEPGGRLLVTCFLLNAESERLIKQGKATQQLVFKLGVAKVQNPSVPEESIGFPEDWMISEVKKRGFNISHIHYGGWSGRSGWTSYQDELVLVRM